MRLKPVLAVVMIALICRPFPVEAQLLKNSDYGAGLTLAFYQYDEARSKQIAEVTVLKQTAATPDEEIDYMTRTFGIDDMKLRHMRSVGLREGEAFTDAQAVNERQFSFTVIPRTVTREDVRVEKDLQETSRNTSSSVR